MSITVPLYGFGGGGTSLNFKVIGGTTEPSNTKENIIWVNTPNKITGWHFTVTQPDNMVEGEVWFATKFSSDVSFNALKKNTVQVYPDSARQWVSGELKDVTAKIYQNGKWCEWWNGDLYLDGNQYEKVTGGWTSLAGRGVEVTFDNKITFTGTGKQDGRDAIAYTTNKIDVTGYKTLVADVSLAYTPNHSYMKYFHLGLAKNITAETHPTAVAEYTATTLVNETVEVDISSVSGEYHIFAHVDIIGGTVNKVRLVR